MSDEKPIGVYVAMNAVMAEIAQIGIQKNHKNKNQGYSFRGIDDVYNALAPIMAKHHLLAIPRFLSCNVEDRTSKSGSLQIHTRVSMELDFICSDDGSLHTAVGIGENIDSSDKSTNKAMTAAYKYMLFQSFCIPVKGTPDADEDSPELAPDTREQDWIDGLANIDDVAAYDIYKAKMLEVFDPAIPKQIKLAFAHRLAALKGVPHGN